MLAEGHVLPLAVHGHPAGVKRGHAVFAQDHVVNSGFGKTHITVNALIFGTITPIPTVGIPTFRANVFGRVVVEKNKVTPGCLPTPA